MSATIDELSVSYTEDGVETVKELDKVVLTKGAWSTILYKYQDWNRTKSEYGPTKFTIRRYQKRNDQYTQKSKFNISSEDQARQLIAALTTWLDQPADWVIGVAVVALSNSEHVSVKHLMQECT